MERPDGAQLPLRHAVLLGLLHGPSELLPISSSGHTALVPWLRDWRYEELDPAARKRFEVALHGGAFLALSSDVAGSLMSLRGRRALVSIVASFPAAIAGLVLERPIERRLGKPASIAAGLLAGSAAMVAAEALGSGKRRASDAGALDGLALGLAQSLALLPGVSRSGAATAAARARGFAPYDAQELASEVGMPVTLGAIALKARDLRRADRREFAPLAAGALASFASTLVAGSVVRRGSSLLPYAAYRAGVAGVVLRRLRKNGRQ
ncbi:MAG TPA: undecaprenyl-diphosphate phosphatase [Solirubrobacteraceae bacterium]|nr:undecaprenyl-diphosphate phosphatase [Solirubrobacteraceae bacterium]